MEHNLNIREEMLLVSPTVAAIGVGMPYSLPDGYFDTLPVELLLKTAPKNSMAVPENYFETLPVEMLLKANGKPAIAHVPAGYFDRFADNMLAKVRALEAEEPELELSPLFTTIGKKTPYSVPEGYFDAVAIPSQMPSIAPVPEQSAVPVVQLKPKRNYIGWAAAACTVGIISLLTWQFGLRDLNQPVDYVAIPAKMDVVDSSAATLELASALAKLEVSSLQKALYQTTATEEDTHSAVYYLNTDNFESAVKDLTDEELEEFLQDSGGITKKS
jgi:hypothetical protein